ncbi:hypothetical protein OCK74_14850 [Chitinophagaceae bacterium LB-8]|uniref:Uncharacterized protein n=1 Tax=Paraflavisolibacter caeni TaxID=2982496 RepID=A0A9X2XXJ9_9BACT|nr:DUF6577 family protein [Paraflavisolibacter caeni]MCU7550397.1 hypothetical protein [Paraflavisolibacter caeni]
MQTFLKFQELIAFLPQDEPFRRDLVGHFYEQKGEVLTEENLKVRVNRLKAKGVIVNIGRGWYRLNNKRIFKPEITATVKKVNSKIRKNFPYLNYQLWSTQWLNQLLTLQLLKSITIVEVESGSEEAVFRNLKESFPYQTFLSPSDEEWANYIADKEETILVRSMISESPKELHQGIRTPKLEKLLVDLYCDRLWQLLFSAEMENIFRESCEKFAINFSTLLSYSARRGKRTEIWQYIKELHVLDSATIDLIER